LIKLIDCLIDAGTGCWDQNPDKRPYFNEVLDYLLAMQRKFNQSGSSIARNEPPPPSAESMDICNSIGNPQLAAPLAHPWELDHRRLIVLSPLPL
jgi:hypothetical protein